jgi:hypothetical protein
VSSGGVGVPDCDVHTSRRASRSASRGATGTRSEVIGDGARSAATRRWHLARSMCRRANPRTPMRGPQTSRRVPRTSRNIPRTPRARSTTSLNVSRRQRVNVQYCGTSSADPASPLDDIAERPAHSADLDANSAARTANIAASVRVSAGRAANWAECFSDVWGSDRRGGALSREYSVTVTSGKRRVAMSQRITPTMYRITSERDRDADRWRGESFARRASHAAASGGTPQCQRDTRQIHRLTR